MRPVIVCTKQRAVYYGYALSTKGKTIRLKKCRNIIRWGTTDGLIQLAVTGPTEKTKVSPKAKVELRSVVTIIEVKQQAEEAWGSLP